VFAEKRKKGKQWNEKGNSIELIAEFLYFQSPSQALFKFVRSLQTFLGASKRFPLLRKQRRNASSLRFPSNNERVFD
jgi:hypothetical protein